MWLHVVCSSEPRIHPINVKDLPLEENNWTVPLLNICFPASCMWEYISFAYSLTPFCTLNRPLIQGEIKTCCTVFHVQPTFWSNHQVVTCYCYFATICLSWPITTMCLHILKSEAMLSDPMTKGHVLFVKIRIDLAKAMPIAERHTSDWTCEGATNI